MSHNIFSAIEFAVKQIAKRNMAVHEYEEFVMAIRRTKMAHLGNITLHDHMFDHATDIANWATDYEFQDYEDKLEAKKRAAIHAVVSPFGWR